MSNSGSINASPSTLCNYINGQWLPPSTSSYIDNFNPATQQLISHIPRSNKQDVGLAVEAARKAQPAWSQLSAQQRADYLLAIANNLQQRLQHYANIESLDTGKPLSLAERVDIPRAVHNFKFFATAILHDETGCHLMSDAVNYTQRHAVGVAGLITPWNLPIYLLSWKVAPALATGNTVVAKPSEFTPLMANELARICEEVNLPAGVFNLIHGYGSEVGQALVEHVDVPLISFTGGTITGRKVASAAAPLFKRVSLELGGKNATVVFDDVEDFHKCVTETVRAAFSNSGQICLCGSKVLVQDTIYDKFVAALVKQTAQYKIGDPLQSSTTFGSLISQQHRDKVESYVELARRDGAAILCGGKRPELPAPYNQGAFYEPTIITGVSLDHRCATEEIFGPVITVHPFKSEDECLQIVNSSKYGLAGSLWSSSVTRCHRFSQSWRTGMVWVNAWLHRDLRVPFGGVNESGVGIEGGRHSLEFYSLTKNICIKTN